MAELKKDGCLPADVNVIHLSPRDQETFVNSLLEADPHPADCLCDDCTCGRCGNRKHDGKCAETPFRFP